MKYQFIAEHRHEYAITLMCRVLDVSVSGYYGCLKAPTEPAQPKRCESLAEHVKAAFQANRRVYGSPRIHAELRDQGIKCAPKRVARLMREQGLFARASPSSHDYARPASRAHRWLPI